MMLFRLLSLPYLRKHLFRWGLTIAGIVLGVAVFVAMHTANQSVIAAFDKTVDQIAGKTQLQVTSGEFGFEESILERVQAVPDVEVAVPSSGARRNGAERSGQHSHPRHRYDGRSQPA
jgi:ABC-type lipoprotein release transport system permease subunit